MRALPIFITPTQLPNLPPVVLAIGNFDGVHLAHQTLINQAKSLANSKGYKTAVLIFEPQPREFFDPKNAPARLNSLDEKCQKFGELGVEFVLVVNFDDAFANLSADDFIDILSQLNAKTLVVGDDFHFGKGRTGNAQTLLGAGFEVQSFESILIDNQRVSSTAIRGFLAQGELAKAKQLLGQAYAITGAVVHGDKIGRTLHFPTANIALNRPKPALHGVFAVAVSTTDGFKSEMGGLKWHNHELFGCANVGTRPSVNGQEWRLEVHLPNFSGDLYGQVLTVRFLHFLHGEQKYGDLTALKNGIRQDIDALLNWYEKNRPSEVVG